MSKINIQPKKLMGDVNIPPSKSMGHRAVICAALSCGTSIIDNIDFSDDIIATIEGMKALGADIKKEGNKLIINGENTLLTFDNNKDRHCKLIDCNESGSTLRFLVPISIAKYNEVRFIGHGNLGKRPLTTYYNIFEKQDIKYSYKNDELDLLVHGELRGGDFEIPGNISSQFISGLLFTLPLLREDSKIIITTNLESKGYIDLTLSMMNKFGIEIENNNYEEFIIKGNQKYKPCNYKVEGDYSQAAFYFCAGALGNNIMCRELDQYSLQGDKECIEILERMGATLKKNSKDSDVNSLGFEKCNLNGTIIDASQCPDIIPVLTVAAALANGETRVINGERLRIKECDRLNAICTELNKLGANIIELDNGLVIHGVEYLKGGYVDSHDDHRIAMSLAIASTRCKGEVIIKNPYCVRKSYPGFWNDFVKLGGNIKVID